ncbi:MAG TPA: transglycosylase domain-containing protein, partial [Myxococcota bacterium]
MSATTRLLLVLLTLPVLVALGWMAYRTATWPDVAVLAGRPPETTAFIERYRRRQRERGLDGAVQWQWVPMSEISPHLARAVVAGEDMEFFSHGGFSTSEMRAAVEEALEGGELRGASTI